ncbi:hypothetical protein ABIB38_003636 [Massilia sp. UYP11]|uniref:RsiV family protein n=1 Tax=Massilia sp. UYP11 TaxID=1756385 RepID=UPI003D1EC8C8
MRAATCVLAVLLALARPVAAQGHGDLLRSPERIEWEAGGLYEGRFPDGTAFQLALAYPAPGGVPGDAAKIMDSAYWFPRDYTGQAHALALLEAPPGALNLVPLLDSGAQGPERLAVDLDADRRGGKGSWRQAPDTPARSFALERIVTYRAVALNRPQARAEGADPPLVFSALFPVFGDAALDAWVREMAGRCDADLECTNKVLVRWHSQGQLSLDASAWTLGHGAAHGNYRSSMRHYALGGGKAVHTRFTGFVDAGTACRDQVSAALVAKLAEQGLSWAEQGALDVFREPKFIPTPSGIEFHWDPYEVGSFSQGIPSVFLTRAELEGCVRNLPRGARIAADG